MTKDTESCIYEFQIQSLLNRLEAFQSKKPNHKCCSVVLLIDFEIYNKGQLHGFLLIVFANLKAIIQRKGHFFF
jgi:hypothetical protein